MRQLSSAIILTAVLAILPTRGIHAQHLSVDTLRAHAALLSGCYKFAWPANTPVLPSPLPSKLELTKYWQRELGYHRAGWFTVRPAHLRALGPSVIWRPIGLDSLEVELMAEPTFSPEDVILAGVVVRDTLNGVLSRITFTTSANSLPKPLTVEVIHFRAVRTACR
jgi:hypothetical protein